MSLKGSANSYAEISGSLSMPAELRGSLSIPSVIHGKSAYEIAVIHGFKGTEEEWIKLLMPDSRRIAEVMLLASGWIGDASPYSQVVKINGVTANSQVDLTPSVAQLAIFHNKDLAFVAENEDGVVTVYAIGDKPTNDYTMQATITEVIYG